MNGGASVNLKEAARILKDRTGSMHEQVAAGAFVHSYYTTEGKHLTRPVRFEDGKMIFTTDAPSNIGDTMRTIDAQLTRMNKMLNRELRRRTRDQGSPEGEYRESFNSRGEHSEMGQRPGGAVGPVVIARVPYPATNCTIGTDGDGNAVIWYHSRIQGGLDPGAAQTGERFITSNVMTNDQRRAVRARVAREQRENATFARRVADAWKVQRSV
jgi:hypothetical protein